MRAPPHPVACSSAAVALACRTTAGSSKSPSALRYAQSWGCARRCGMEYSYGTVLPSMLARKHLTCVRLRPGAVSAGGRRVRIAVRVLGHAAVAHAAKAVSCPQSAGCSLQDTGFTGPWQRVRSSVHAAAAATVPHAAGSRYVRGSLLAPDWQQGTRDLQPRVARLSQLSRACVLPYDQC
jgi:hypothetical protein